VSIKNTLANSEDYVELGKKCWAVGNILNQGLEGKNKDDLSKAVLITIEDLSK
jgi:hypothetical protein